MIKSRGHRHVTDTIQLFLILFLIGTAILFSSCRQSPQVNSTDDEVMIRVPGSELYVRVRGDGGGPLLINLHGVPGGYSGIDIQWY